MLDVDFFHDKLNRLKTVLGVTKDKEAGEALGLKEKAFNARKTRGSFPEKELRALAQQRPELGIDVEYVLTGGKLSARERQALESARASGQGDPRLLDQAGVEAAQVNARRAALYEQINEVLRQCRSDETVALALTLVVKLHRAELGEEKAARGGQ